MKIAYLIQAHSNYNHLRRLIQALRMEGAAFFVHIDKKSPLPDTTDFPPDTFFIEKRVKVYWAAFSQVQATLNLMEAATSKGSFDYYALISGADYPIQPLEFLMSRLRTGKEFINLHPGFQDHKPKHRLENFHFQYFDRRNRRKWSSLFFLGMEKLLKTVGYKRPVLENTGSGSSWFILSNSCIHFIQDYLRKNPGFVNYYKRALSPDEYFFQTIINRSPYADNTTGHLTYTDWIEGEGSPAMIGEKHIRLFEKLKEEGELPYFFARKFDDQSEALIRRYLE